MFKFCICFSISVRLNSVLKNMRRLLRLSIKQTFSRSTNGEIITLWYFVHTINATKIRQLELSKNLFNETVNLLFFSSMNDEIYERLCIHGEMALFGLFERVIKNYKIIFQNIFPALNMTNLKDNFQQTLFDFGSSWPYFLCFH